MSPASPAPDRRGHPAATDEAAAPTGGNPLRAPSMPVAAGLAAAPLAAVLQSKALAPLALVVMALAVIAHRRRHGTWPWPRAAATWAAVAIGAWGLVSLAWSIAPARSLESAASFGGAALLAGAAARAVAEDGAAAKARLAHWLGLGLALGLAAALFDDLSGNALRAAVRGLREAAPVAMLAFGLKPAAAVMAMLLPLALAAPWPALLRLALAAAGAAVLLVLPGESAKLAALVGLAAAGAAWLAPRLVPLLLGALLAALILLAPTLLSPALEAAAPRAAAALSHSAAHRLVIWDFSLSRIAGKPLLGWGMETSRAIPGGAQGPSAAMLDRLGITGPVQRGFLLSPGVQRMPLHPHSAALQVRLELGLPGALLAAALALLLGLAARRGPHPPAATGALAAGAVSAMLSFGIWQAWWFAALMLVAVGAAGLPAWRAPGPR